MKTDVNKYFREKKIEINSCTKKIFEDTESDFKDFGSLGASVIRKLKDLSLLGKGVRGGLLIFSSESYHAQNPEIALHLAASVELIHSALLIHDDIADNDLIRRGKPTIHAKYLEYAKSESITNPQDFAKSISMIIGDLGFFLALSHISLITKKLKQGQEILRLISDEISLVCLAQIDDIRFGYFNNDIDENDIKRVYKYKTARYSFSLPLLLGAKLAGVKVDQQKLLRQIGSNLGFIYQLRDDEIGLFSDDETIGKPVGSDIRENKKTLLRQFLYQKVSVSDRKFLDETFGNKNLSKVDIDKVRKLILEFGIKKRLDSLIISYKSEVKTDINKLSVSAKSKQFLNDLADYVKNRDK